LLRRKQAKRSERDRGPVCRWCLIRHRLTPLNTD
jgi:hypothetical protein